jgi:hypothetical protein
MWGHDGLSNLKVTANTPVLPYFDLYHEINMIHQGTMEVPMPKGYGR